MIPARHRTARLDTARIHSTRARPADDLLAAAVLALALMALTLTFGAATARADIGEKIIDRCTHGESLRGFSQADYRQALKDMSAGTEEYSNCAQLIRQAQLEGAAAGHGGAPASTGAAPGAAGVVAATPAQRQAIARAPIAGASPVEVGGQTIHPGVVHADIASALSSLPTPLLATIAFLLVGLVVVAGSGIRKRILRIRRSQ